MRWRAGGESKKRDASTRGGSSKWEGPRWWSSRHGKWRGLSAQLPGCERTHDQRKRQEMERPSQRAEDIRLLLELEQQFQKHRLETMAGVGGCGARSVG